MTRAILHAQEKERNVIGRELHDNVNQILAGTKLLLTTAQLYPHKMDEILVSAISNLQHAIDENRKIAHELVAPDFSEVKIADQLNELFDSMLVKTGIAVNLQTFASDELVLDDEQKLAIYRVAQEQCTNIIKHSGATAVTISTACLNDTYILAITDNGNGMEKDKLARGIGLRNIRSRLELFNGTMEISTAPAQGFGIKISIPLKTHPRLHE